MSVFKDFTEDCYPDPDESVVLYDVNDNTYNFITTFDFDRYHFLDTGEIREWMGESKSQGRIYRYFPKNSKWTYAKDIVDAFCTRLGLVEE